MICYKDRTFCCSPNCTNECGRKLTEEVKEEAKKVGLPICVSMFCSKDITVSDVLRRRLGV